MINSIKCFIGFHKIEKWYGYTAGAKIGICNNCKNQILDIDETFINGESKLDDWSKYLIDSKYIIDNNKL